MKTEVLEKCKVHISETERRKYYMSEYSLWVGDHFVTFNILDIDTDKNEITVAVTDEGRISVREFDLIQINGRLFFEYGVMYTQIAVDEFIAEEDCNN